VVTLPYLFSLLVLLCQAASPLVEVVVEGCYQVYVQNPCSFSEEDVQNHCHHCWVQCEFSKGVKRSSWQGPSHVNIFFLHFVVTL
jgi:hypothetical protein